MIELEIFQLALDKFIDDMEEFIEATRQEYNCDWIDAIYTTQRKYEHYWQACMSEAREEILNGELNGG